MGAWPYVVGLKWSANKLEHRQIIGKAAQRGPNNFLFAMPDGSQIITLIDQRGAERS